jgi:hypothetical protein
MDDLITQVRRILAEHWQWVQDNWAQLPEPKHVVDKEFADKVRQVVNSDTKSYRYVLPTQLGAKLADPDLDARCLQVGAREQGHIQGKSFDARSVCHEVIVPFDQEHGRVLNGSREPYVNNPLRCPAVSPKFRGQQRNKKDWDLLCNLLNEVEAKNNPQFTQALFRQTLIEIYRRLQKTQVAYPVPARVSLEDTLRLLKQYLGQPSGGLGLQAVITALFRTLGRHWNLWGEVQTAPVHAADQPTGRVADIECFDRSGQVCCVAETKERSIQIGDVETVLNRAKERRVTELFFFASDKPSVDLTALIRREFAFGQNIYVFRPIEFAKPVLALVGLEGRAQFLREIGAVLNEMNASYQDRARWRDLLQKVLGGSAASPSGQPLMAPRADG